MTNKICRQARFLIRETVKDKKHQQSQHQPERHANKPYAQAREAIEHEATNYYKNERIRSWTTSQLLETTKNTNSRKIEYLTCIAKAE